MSTLWQGPVPTAAGTGVRGVAPGWYTVAPTRSTLTFRVRMLGSFTVRGTFAIRSGRVEVGDGIARALVDVDAASVTTASRRRDADVRGPRFLDAATFRSLTWTGELADGTSTATGTLRVRGVAVPAAVEVWAVEVGPRAVRVHAWARVDRLAAGVSAARRIVGRVLDLDVELTLLPD